MDFTFANQINQRIDDEKQIKLIDELIADIDDELNSYTEEFETEVDYLMFGAVAGAMTAFHLLQLFF